MYDIKIKDKTIIPHWLKRELAVFGGMFTESIKFIFVSIFIFASIYGVINVPALWKNVKWWWYVNYVDDKSGAWWGLQLPEVSQSAKPDNTILIPKIGVQAPIIYSRNRDAKEINELLLNGVVHYADTALPGDEGNVFITGHSSYYWWSDGKYNNVFGILDKLIVGDKIDIYYDGIKYVYSVREVKIVFPSDVSVLDGKPGRRLLTLMTCSPVGTNYKRLIVVAEQIDPSSNKNTGAKATLPLSN